MTNIKLLVLDQPVYEVAIKTLFYIRRSKTQEPLDLLEFYAIYEFLRQFV